MAAPLRLLLTLNTAFCPYDSPIKAPNIFTQNPNFFKPSSPPSSFKPKWVDTKSPHHCRRTLSSKQKVSLSLSFYISQIYLSVYPYIQKDAFFATFPSSLFFLGERRCVIELGFTSLAYCSSFLFIAMKF